jgi:hypothetical protein
MFSRKSTRRGARRVRTFTGAPMLWYGDTLRTEVKLRRREESLYLPN